MLLYFKYYLRNKTRLREEVDTVIGSKTLLSHEDLVELKYTGAVIKETLRLWAIIGFITRVNPYDDFKINSMHIPKDTILQVTILLIYILWKKNL